MEKWFCKKQFLYNFRFSELSSEIGVLSWMLFESLF